MKQGICYCDFVELKLYITIIKARFVDFQMSIFVICETGKLDFIIITESIILDYYLLSCI